MIADYYRTLVKRTVTKVSDGAGGSTETTADTNFQGTVLELTGQELVRNQMLQNDATAVLLTEAVLSQKDRVVDGTVEYEIVFPFKDFHTRYLLKRRQ